MYGLAPKAAIERTYELTRLWQEHTLGARRILIAKVQAKATLSSGWLGLVGSISAALLGAVLGYFLSVVSAKYESKSQPAAESSQQKSAIPIQRPSIPTKPPAQNFLVPSDKSADVRPSNSEGQPTQHNGNNKP